MHFIRLLITGPSLPRSHLLSRSLSLSIAFSLHSSLPVYLSPPFFPSPSLWAALAVCHWGDNVGCHSMSGAHWSLTVWLSKPVEKQGPHFGKTWPFLSTIQPHPDSLSDMHCMEHLDSITQGHWRSGNPHSPCKVSGGPCTCNLKPMSKCYIFF